MTPFGRILHRVLIVILLLLPVKASAQETLAVPQPSPNDLHEFTRLLADERIQNWIQDQADGAEAAAPVAQKSIREQFQSATEQVGARVGALGAAWASFGAAPAVISEKWQAQMTPDRRVRSLTFALIFLFFGAGLEWLIRQYTNPVLRRIEVQTFKSPKKRALAALSRSALAFTGVLTFAVGSIGAFSAVSWPPLLYTLILSTLLGIVSVRAIHTLVRLFLAPRIAELRLIPITTPMARVLGNTLTFFFAMLVFAVSLIDVFGQLTNVDATGALAPETLAVSVLFATILLIVSLICIVFCFAQAKHHTSSLSYPSLSRWRAYMCVLSTLIFVTWLFDVRPLMWTIMTIGLAIPSVKLLRGWTDLTFDQAIADFRAKAEKTAALAAPTGPDEAPDTPDEPAEPEPIVDPYETYRPIVQRLIRFGVFVVVGLILALIWHAGIFENTDTPTVTQRLFSVLIDSAAAVLIADLVWTWGKTSIDRRLAAYKPPEDGQAPGPEARMATLLPLLRVVLMVTLLSMVLMSVLSSMGVNIAPILAGASVMGIAIGFGAQSLVKDVVSGIFFLVDDAFRVGEYVEIDQLRGTVEKISIRSLQIRHHRGAVHTLPFGELKSMTNYSRDWVIMKLEFRVPFDTDLQLVKKLVKKVGAELKANEHYGDAILDTLKSQGVRRMEEFNMVVGVKFMTRPGEQWLVRRDAYQKVRDAFEANGIRMAERNVKVELSGDENLTEDERKAVTAAAQEAVTQPLKPGVVPDEP
ncbi:mechanosensitive ion channel family protein [Roseobacter sp. YSTF-M11]|uniref:Mechanosensitive ion channel family protein n=1 Tax=Roseobacter insulae TaxID=2859783 RepID=A0A9X1FX20_9RHOB|nr:mechanosensitive ion channel domain-containing protein [Roseobacter insulae]MBW4708964.1 mechanosensitive ion channel family protein [Roseobacter insulae]